MSYYINPEVLRSVITVPSSALDNLKLASAVQLRVLLCCFADTKGGISAECISEKLGITSDEVEDALIFWSQNGVFKIEGKSLEKEHEPIVSPDVKPSRQDVIKRGNEDPQLQLLLREAQMRFGRNLKSNESQILVWLCDDKGMDVSVILLLMQYAATCGKLKIGFIEKTATEWLDDGVETVADAEKRIADAARQQLCWKTVRQAFGIDRALPGKKEKEFSVVWVEEWKFSYEMLRAAYEICVDATSKLSFPYINKILKSWHKDGIKKPDDIKLTKSENVKRENAAGYDIAAFEDMLNNE